MNIEAYIRSLVGVTNNMLQQNKLPILHCVSGYSPDSQLHRVELAVHWRYKQEKS